MPKQKELRHLFIDTLAMTPRQRDKFRMLLVWLLRRRYAVSTERTPDGTATLTVIPHYPSEYVDLLEPDELLEEKCNDAVDRAICRRDRLVHFTSAFIGSPAV